jgi:hypothetical protein
MTTAAAIDPGRAAALLGHGITEAFVGKMLDHPRARRRFFELVESRLGAASPTPVQAAALALDSRGLAELARRTGAVWLAASMVQMIDGPAIRDLVAAIGSELRQFAIHHYALAPPLSETVPVEALAGQIDVAGYRCLSAWCAAQPAPVGRRIALHLPAEVPLAEPFRVHGPGIVDALLAAGKGSTP